MTSAGLPRKPRRPRAARRPGDATAGGEPRTAPAGRTPGSAGALRRATLVLVAVWALLFAPQLFASRIYTIGDAGTIRAYAEFSADRWHAHHDRTHWNPYIFGGLPATASLQDSRPQWLPDPLLTAFDAVHRIPGFPPLAIPLLVHLAGMIAMAALARALWGAGPLAMVWAGVAWGLLPNLLVPLAFGQDWLVMASALMPVVLVAVSRAAAAVSIRERIAAALGLSLATACLGLAAHPQIILLTLPLAAGLALERAARHRRPPALLDMGVAVALGAAMSAAVLWPAHLYNAWSVRGGEGGGVAIGEIAAWSAALPDLVSLAWPWAAGFGGRTYWGGLHGTDFPQFVGLGVCALALWGLGRRDANGRAAAGFALAAVAAALLAMGVRLGPLFHAIHDHIPLWSSIRVAIRTLVVAELAIVLLSARGLERLADAARREPGRWMGIATGTGAVALLGGALLGWGVLGDVYARAVSAARPAMDGAAVAAVTHHAALDLAWRGVALALLVAALALSARPRWRRASAGVVLLLALDLGTVGVPFLLRSSGPVRALERPPAPRIARLAGADPGARVFDVSHERMLSNDWIRWRVRSLSGNHPAMPRTWSDIAGAGLLRRPAFLRAIAVGYVGGGAALVADSTRLETSGAETDGRAVWRLEDALPRAYAVAAVHREPDDRAVLAALAAPDLDGRRDAFTTDAGIDGRYADPARCRIRWVRDDPDHLVLETAADSAAFIVIADPWFPGWRATLDGAARPIQRLQHFGRGVVVPAGPHRLSLDYEPEGWRAGLAWAWAAWAVWLAAGLATALAAWRGRRAPAAPPAS